MTQLNKEANGTVDSLTLPRTGRKRFSMFQSIGQKVRDASLNRQKKIQEEKQAAAVKSRALSADSEEANKVKGKIKIISSSFPLYFWHEYTSDSLARLPSPVP